MHKKYVFVDMDGTILDHSTMIIPEKTKIAIKEAKKNGHEIIVSTGRPPCLLHGFDKEIELDSYVAANGRVVVYKGEVVHSNHIDKEIIKKVVDFAENLRIDIAFEGMHGYILQTAYEDTYIKFCDGFHLEYPIVIKDYYLNHDIYQLNLFYTKEDYSELEALFPTLNFGFASKYGLDINTKGGLKEEGIKVLEEKMNIPHEDIIAIGDGHNDITMFNYVTTSVAMGNATEDVKKHATIVTDHISNDGLYNAFKTLKLI